jgi:hypothetical protein
LKVSSRCLMTKGALMVLDSNDYGVRD